MSYHHTHYTEFRTNEWPLRYFRPREFACSHCGYIADGTEQTKARQSLDDLRHILGGPIIVNSATRCSFHNHNVGGAKDSQHLQGLAFDICPPGTWGFSRFEIQCIYFARQLGFIGIGLYPTFIHLDRRDLPIQFAPVTWIDST